MTNFGKVKFSHISKVHRQIISNFDFDCLWFQTRKSWSWSTTFYQIYFLQRDFFGQHKVVIKNIFLKRVDRKVCRGNSRGQIYKNETGLVQSNFSKKTGLVIKFFTYLSILKSSQVIQKNIFLPLCVTPSLLLCYLILSFKTCGSIKT